MDLEALWQNFLHGASSVGEALLFAALALVASLLSIALVLRPLVRFVSSREPEKVRSSLVKRLSFALILTALAFSAFVFCHATLDPDIRHDRLAYQLTELVLIVGVSYATFEILLTLFCDWIPQVVGRAPVSPFFKDILRTLVFVALFVVGLKQSFPRADIGAIMTTSAILSIVLGLALQESLSNVFAGIMLTIDRPFKTGDWIEVDAKEGKVLDSNWRSTRILTRDDDILTVPNNILAKSILINVTAPTPLHLCRRRLGIEYGAPPNKVRAVLVDMILHVDGVLREPAPDVFVADYADFAVIYELRFWIEDHGRRTRIESEVLRAVWYHLKRNGISIPFPVRDVVLRQEKPAHRPDEVLGLLKHIDILQPLNERELLMLADDLTCQLFAKGEVICRQGEAGSTFYLIKSGVVSVRVRGDEGVEAEVAQLKTGACFGEMSLLTGEPRTSTCRALEDCELLCLDRESFGILLKENPPIAQAMSEKLASRMLDTKEKLTQERETMIRRRSGETESGSRRILERIWTLFGFRR